MDATKTYNSPEDKMNFAYILITILGVGALLPWNAFITPVEYMMNTYGNKVLFFLGLAYNYPQIPLFMILLKWGHLVTFRVRLVTGFIAVTLALAVVPAIPSMGLSQNSSLIVLLGCTFVAGVAACINFGSTAGLSSPLPSKYPSALMMGNGIAGIMAWLLSVFCKVSVSKSQVGVYFFGGATIVLGFCCVAGYVAPGLPFVKYFQSKAAGMSFSVNDERTALLSDGGALKDTDSTTSDDDLEAELAAADTLGLSQSEIDSAGFKYYVAIMKAMPAMFISIFSVFAVSLAIFPGITSLQEPHQFLTGNEGWYIVVIVGVFMWGDWIGRSLAPMVQLVGPKYLVWFCLARLGFFPLIIMCAKNVFANNWIVFAINLFFSLTNGYFSTLAMMYGPSQVPPQFRENAGVAMAFFLNVGILVGVNIGAALSALF